MKTKILVLFLFASLLTSCATYIMEPQSLVSVLKNGTPKAGITSINVIDKEGNTKVLNPTIHTSIRITKIDGSRQQFYFITANLEDSLINGSKSVIFKMPIKPIKISDVKKVEFDGR